MQIEWIYLLARLGVLVEESIGRAYVECIINVLYRPYHIGTESVNGESPTSIEPGEEGTDDSKYEVYKSEESRWE